MIRPLDWRDVGLLRRLRNRGLCLDSQLSYTRGPNTFQTILVDLVTPGRIAYTLVSRPDEKEQHAAIGQIHHRPGESHAKLAFLGPEAVFADSDGLQLLDALAQTAGEQGAQHMIAEIDEQNPVFETLRRAGYAIYARQRIWQWQPNSGDGRPNSKTVWRPIEPSDEAAVNHLYHNIVPALVQQVELPPRQNRGGFVHYAEGELLGYLDIESGPRGIWVHPYFHPAAEEFNKLITNFLVTYSETRKRPLFISMRSYQGWMSHGLEKVGFKVCSDQAVMVKRLTAMLRKPVLARLPAVEGSHPEPTTPLIGNSLSK